MRERNPGSMGRRSRENWNEGDTGKRLCAVRQNGDESERSMARATEMLATGMANHQSESADRGVVNRAATGIQPGA